jgi:hypothetical protein
MSLYAGPVAIDWALGTIADIENAPNRRSRCVLELLLQPEPLYRAAGLTTRLASASKVMRSP